MLTGYRNGNDVAWKKKFEVHDREVLRHIWVRHVPHFLPQSEKVIHVFPVGKSSKFWRRGSFGGPGGKTIERLVKNFFSNTIVNIANAISSNGSMTIDNGMHCYHVHLYSWACRSNLSSGNPRSKPWYQGFQRHNRTLLDAFQSNSGPWN